MREPPTGRAASTAALAPPTVVRPETAGDGHPASTATGQAMDPGVRFKAYTFPSVAGAITFGPRSAGEAAPEPPVGTTHRSCPETASRARTPYGGSNVTWLVV